MVGREKTALSGDGVGGQQMAFLWRFQGHSSTLRSFLSRTEAYTNMALHPTIEPLGDATGNPSKFTPEPV